MVTVLAMSEVGSLPRAHDSVYLDVDGAWPADIGPPRVDARIWGPRLRCFAPRSDAEAFYSEVIRTLPPFALSGSGDFHHLTGLFLRRIDTPLTVISFDNHPDWDIRPPRWACGGWVNRALELPHVRRVLVWGCGNFELAWPHRLFANRRALRDDRLQVNAWAERQSLPVRRRFDCMTRDDWRGRFERFAAELNGSDIYVTVDLDCVRAEEAVTNWESGLFSADDVAWAIGQLRSSGNIVAGDLCGGWSLPNYARWIQKFAAEWDRPKQPVPEPAAAQATNAAALRKIWPELVGPIHTASRKIQD